MWRLGGGTPTGTATVSPAANTATPSAACGQGHTPWERTRQQLLEDEFTGIMERTSVAGDPRVARAVAQVHLAAFLVAPQVARTYLLRQAMLRIRRLLTVVHFQALNDQQLAALLQEVYQDTLRSITHD
jgi:hypothetical protein